MNNPGNRSADFTDADAARLRQYEELHEDGVELTPEEFADMRDLLNRESEAWNAQFLKAPDAA